MKTKNSKSQSQGISRLWMHTYRNQQTASQGQKNTNEANKLFI